MNYLDLLTDDLIEKILETSIDDYDNQLNILDSKIKMIKDKLEPLNISFDDEENCKVITYENVMYCIENNLFERVYEDNIIFINRYDEYFSNGNGEDYISNTYNNPSYFDILVEANKSILHTGDYHHTFLEGINQIENEDVYEYVGIKPNDNFKYYEFMLGS